MVSDTWCPKVDDQVKCVDTGYTGCEEKPFIGQLGRVIAEYKEHGHVLVIQFYLTKKNGFTRKESDGTPSKTFNEYLCVSRGVNLFFEPVKE